MTVRNTHRLPCFSLALLLAVVLGLASPASAQEARTWTDSTGKFRIQGKLVEVADGNVTLEQTDGQRMEIPLARLSQADQDFIKAQENDNPFKPKSDNPFKPQTPSGAMPAAGGAMPAATGGGEGVVDDSGAFESRLVSPALQSMNTIPLDFGNTGWKVDVASLLGDTPENHSGKPVPMPPTTDFFEKANGFVLNAAGTKAAVSYKLEKGGTFQTRVVIADLKTGKTIANRATGGPLAVRALSDDGGTVVMGRDEFGWGNNDRLELWNVTDKGIRKGMAWRPFDDATGMDRDVLFAAFAADGRFLTSTHSGRVIAWTLNPLRAEWSCQGQRGCRPALSPGRKHLLLTTDKQLCLIDMATAAIIASRPAPQVTFPHMSFSPEGTRCAMMGVGEGVVFDTATGETYREIEKALLPNFGSHTRALFVNEDQAIFGERYLLDLPSLVSIWEYSGADSVTDQNGIIWYLKQDGNQRPGVMFGAPLPHAGATDALKTAMNDPDYFILKPGKSVKLNLDALPDAAKREEIRKALTAKLAEQQITVSPSAPVEVVCRFDSPKSENISYHEFGSIGTQTVSFPVTVAHITFTAEGKQLWHASASNRPGMVSRSRDQTLQDALKKYEALPYDFFKNTDLPKMLVSPSKGAGQTLGRLIVTTSGLRDDPRPQIPGR